MKRLIKKIRIRLNKTFGRPYMVNHSSKEVHDLNNEHINCYLADIVNYEFVSRKKAIDLIDLSMEYNGCRWCNKEYDTDLKK